MIIDFHAHVKRDPVSKVYDIEDCLRDMKACGIDKRVISTLEGRSVHDINNAIVDFVQQYPDQLLGCAVINPKEDDCVEEARRVATMPEICALEFDPWEHGYLPERMEYHLDPILDIAAENSLVVKDVFWVGSAYSAYAVGKICAPAPGCDICSAAYWRH